MFNGLIRRGLPLLASLALSSCGGDRSTPASPAARPSLILVSIDTLRADHVGAYGAQGVETPNLDALARDGVLFERVLTPVPITLPSHATLLTGWFPHRHGVRDNGLYTLPSDPQSLGGLLQGAGYDTAAVVAADVLDRQYGLDRGFRAYDDAVGARGLSIAERPARAVTDAALRVATHLRRPSSSCTTTTRTPPTGRLRRGRSASATARTTARSLTSILSWAVSSVTSGHASWTSSWP